MFVPSAHKASFSSFLLWAIAILSVLPSLALHTPKCGGGGSVFVGIWSVQMTCIETVGQRGRARTPGKTSGFSWSRMWHRQDGGSTAHDQHQNCRAGRRSSEALQIHRCPSIHIYCDKPLQCISSMKRTHMSLILDINICKISRARCVPIV